jgi:hypothetical protein
MQTANEKFNIERFKKDWITTFGTMAQRHITSNNALKVA